jgi:hypothetical protein
VKNPPRSLEGVDWGAVYVRAISIARQSVRPGDVDDLVTEGVRRVLDGAAPWDESRKRTLADHVVAVGYNAMREEWRKRKQPRDERFIVRFSVTVEEESQRTPEDSAADAEERERRARLFARLLVLCAADAEASAVLECEQLGVHEPAEQVTRAGLSIDAVRNARKRIKRHVQELIDDERGARDGDGP